MPFGDKVLLGPQLRTRCELGGNAAKLLEREFQAGHDLGGDLVRWRQAVGICCTRILEPEYVEVELAAE